MAKEIEDLKVSGMTNGVHFDYMSMAVEAAEADSTVSAKAKDETAALTEEDECLQLSRKNALSDQIAEQDALRDQYYSGYKAAVKAMLSMPEGDVLEAYLRLVAGGRGNEHIRSTENAGSQERQHNGDLRQHG